MDDAYAEQAKLWKGIIKTTSKPPKYSFPRSTCFFYSIKDAVSAIEHDLGHMSSCRFTYAVIEEYEEGYFSLGIAKLWYKFNIEKNTWKKIKAPKWGEGTVNYALG